MDNNKLLLFVIILLVAFFALSNRPTGNVVVSNDSYQDMINYEMPTSEYSSLEKLDPQSYSQEVMAPLICQVMNDRRSVLSGAPEPLMAGLEDVVDNCPGSIDTELQPVAGLLAQMV